MMFDFTGNEIIVEYANVSELRKLRRTSINYSICWLRENVWNRRYFKTQGRCGFYSRSYIQKPFNTDKERQLRHSVQHWKALLERQPVFKQNALTWNFLTRKVGKDAAKIIIEKSENNNTWNTVSDNNNWNLT